MEASPYATKAKLTILTGFAATGKTEALVREAARLYEQSAADESIVVFAATEPACEAFRARFGAFSDGAARRVRVTTLREYERSVLTTPAACAATGRKGRILQKFEENLLMEDLKTSGLLPKRLREMLRFFYRSWSDLEPMDSAWFYNSEEENLHDQLKRYLDFYGAYLSVGLPRAAHDLLIHNPAYARECEIDHVLVDDFQLLSKASQSVACMVASKTLCVAGDAAASAPAIEEFPYPDGLECAAQANPGCTVRTLAARRSSPHVAHAVDLVRTREASVAPTCDGEGFCLDACCVSRAARPHDEFDAITRFVASAIDAGIDPCEIRVAAPSEIWKRNLASTLRRSGIPVASIVRESFGGDARSLERCAQARAITLLRLATDPDDQLALRCWCGFGDYLANSAAMKQIVDEGARLSLDEGIVWSSGAAAHDALIEQEEARIDEALHAAAEALEAMAGTYGSGLVDVLEGIVAQDAADGSLKALRRIAEALPSDAQALAFCEEVQRRALGPRVEGDGVVLGTLSQFAGLPGEVVVLAGMVNGFVPNRDYFDPTVVERDKRPKLLAKASAAVYGCAGKAQRTLAFSYFTEALLTDAEALKLKIYRVRLRNGQRVCEIHPSDAISPITGVCTDD